MRVFVWMHAIISGSEVTSEPRADAVSSETMEASRPQVLETRCGENSSTSFLKLFLTGSTTITSIFSSTSRKLVIPIRFSSVYGSNKCVKYMPKCSPSIIHFLGCRLHPCPPSLKWGQWCKMYDVQKLTWLSFSIWATSRGKRWARAESFSVLTCLTSERNSTSPSYAMGRMDVSLTEVLQRADMTAASRRLLDVRKLASAMS